MSLTVKAFLEEGERLKEIRRFAIDHAVATNYEFVVQKIARIFPSLQGKKFRTYWRDAEGDNVAFSSDEELVEALAHKEDPFKVYLTVDAAVAAHGGSCGATTADGASVVRSEPTAATAVLGPMLHPHVKCDVCAGPVRGMRFKCTVCPDYDLCSACERRGEHAEHDMLRIAKPRGSSCPYVRSLLLPPPPQPTFPLPTSCRGPAPYCGAPLHGVPKEWGLRCNGDGSCGRGCSGRGAAAAPSGSGAVGAEAATTEPAYLDADVLLEPLDFEVVLELNDRPLGSAVAASEPMATESSGGDDGVGGKQQQREEPPAAAPASAAVAAAASGTSSQKPGSSYPFWPTDVSSVPWQHAPAPMNQLRQREVEEEELNVRVFLAVENMRAMGFHNDDGWLTALLRSNGCDVQKAVDEVLRRSPYRQP